MQVWPPSCQVGDHVGLFDAGEVDVLARLDLGQRLDAVAQARGALEVQRVARRAHLQHQAVLDLAALAGQEVARLAHQLAVVRFRDALHAGRGAALDLVLQAGPGAHREHAVAAIAQQEGALQGDDGAVDRAGGGEGPEILARPVARAAMLGDLRDRDGRR